jgi:catechol 2,3-dioxygenase-like lactoylglutathione lyase family enzyme
MVMPELTGVLETARYVEDLDRSVRFYQALLGLEILEQDDGFCGLSVLGRQVLLIFRKGAKMAPSADPAHSVPPHGGSGQLHLAFAIPASSLAAWEERLRGAGIPIESRVTWPRGGRSLYFRDPDGHSLELATPGTWATY